MKGQIGLWSMGVGLLILILISPMLYNIISGVSGGVSDPASVAIMYAMPAIMFFVFVFVILFFARVGGQDESY